MAKRADKSKRRPSRLLAAGRKWFSEKRPVLRFAGQFGVLLLVFYAALALPYFDRWLYVYLKVDAWLSNAILVALGQQTHLTDVTIQSPRFAIAVRRGCDAVEPTWLFCAAVLSFRASPKQKALGILAGLIVLQLLNLVRIVSLFCIGAYSSGFFNTAHLELWPAAFILAAILLFAGWIDWVSTRRPPPSPHAAA